MNNSFMKRIVLGKSVGLIVGIVAFLMIPQMLPDVSMMMRVGIVFWYVMIGGVVAVFGVIDYHPILKIRINAWFRGAVVGGSMTLPLVLIVHDTLASMTNSAVVFTGMSPFWIILEGVVVGILIDVLITKRTGEGSLLTEGCCLNSSQEIEK